MSSPKEIDLCSDVGSSFGRHRIGEDEAVIPAITSANIDCGWHAGDPMVMDRTVRMVLQEGVSPGAHPGFPDLMGFGQRNLDCTQDEIVNYVLYQLGALHAFCLAHGTRIAHVKPAGNLYLMAVERSDVAAACAEGAARFDTDLVYVALAGEKGERMAQAARQAGLRVAREFFADRAYSSEGTLVSRRLLGSLITDPVQAAERALQMIEQSTVDAIDGTVLHMEAQTICVHSFQTGSGRMAKTIREVLLKAGISLKPMTQLV